MEKRALGKTGLGLSAIGFGCGMVGGLMIRGTAAEQERAVARAVELGINYFDTAPLYGNGESERCLGRALAALKPDVVVGTKVQIKGEQRRNIGDAVAASLEESLRRLGRDAVDLLQLHTPLGAAPDRLTAAEVLNEVVPACEEARRQGKIRHFGLTATGDTAPTIEVIESGAVETAQMVYNLLNPSAGAVVENGYPGQDFGRMLDRAAEAGVGVLAIRVLAAGALSGLIERHAYASPLVAPIGTGRDFAADAERARLFTSLLQAGYAESLPEAALRFALAQPAITTVLVGLSTLDQLECAAQAAEKGPLPSPALTMAAEIQGGLIPI